MSAANTWGRWLAKGNAIFFLSACIHLLLSSVGCPESGDLLSLMRATFLFQRTTTVHWGMRELPMNFSLPWSKQMSGVSLSFTCSLARLLTYWLTHSLTHWLTHSRTHSHTDSRTHSHTSMTGPLSLSLIPSFIHSLIRPSSMHPPTHPSFYLLFLSPPIMVSALRSKGGNTERPY